MSFQQNLDTSSTLPNNPYSGGKENDLSSVYLREAKVYIRRQQPIAQNSLVKIWVGKRQLNGRIRLKTDDTENVLIFFLDNQRNSYTIERNKKDIIAY
ncbi:MAG: hypothetical protein HC817_13025 [Saprospiraceae bacterium]|nr:hypothetical protein [Saprospiraceae bacterium]